MPRRPIPDSSKELFRTDAKADDGVVRVGGWETRFTLNTQEARWFAVESTEANSPWIGCRGEPFRVVAALVMLVSLFGVLAFWPEGPGVDGTAVLGGASGTDNRADSYIVARTMTTKFPLCAVLMEMTEQLSARDSWLRLSWVPRQQNEEAYVLTNACLEAFDPERRVHLDPPRHSGRSWAR